MGVDQHLIAVLTYIDFSLVILSIFASAYQTFVFPVPEIAYLYLLSISLLGNLSFFHIYLEKFFVYSDFQTWIAMCIADLFSSWWDVFLIRCDFW